MESGKSIIKKIISVLTTVLLVISVLLCAGLTIKGITGKDSSFLGYRAFYVVTGSMEPTIHTGAVILTKAAPGGEYQLGDVITFVTSVAEISGRPNTHRIVGIDRRADGVYYITKGDANNVPDADPVSADAIYGKVVGHTGDMRWLGTLLGFVTTPLGFASMILIPVVLISGSLFRDFTREFKQAAREKAEEEYLASRKKAMADKTIK